MKYTVIRPIYEKTGESKLTATGSVIHFERVAEWETVGPADSIEDAKQRYKPSEYGYAVVMV